MSIIAAFNKIDRSLEAIGRRDYMIERVIDESDIAFDVLKAAEKEGFTRDRYFFCPS